MHLARKARAAKTRAHRIVHYRGWLWCLAGPRHVTRAGLPSLETSHPYPVGPPFMPLSGTRARAVYRIPRTRRTWATMHRHPTLAPMGRLYAMRRRCRDRCRRLPCRSGRARMPFNGWRKYPSKLGLLQAGRASITAASTGSASHGRAARLFPQRGAGQCVADAAGALQAAGCADEDTVELLQQSRIKFTAQGGRGLA